MIFIRTDILNPYNPKIISQDKYETLIKFLLFYFPSGFDRPVDISVNGFIIEVDEYDIELKDEDVIVILDRTSLPVGLIGGWFITALANLAISVTLSYVANKLFAPDEPEEQAKPSSVYNVASGQNTAKYGSPIPIVYGKVRMYPSMIVNPYYRFENNIEYLYHVLCIGQGQYTTDSVMIGEDTITSPGDLQYKLMNKDTFYNIPLNAYGRHITRTLSSPSNLELKEGVLTEEYTIKQGTHTVEVDYHYPNGLYATNDSGGYDLGLGAFTYYIRSSTGALLFTGRAADVGITADPIQKTIAKNVGTWTADDYITISFEQDVTLDDPSYSETNYVKRVKEIYPNKDFTQLYGDITLLACKIKATNAVSSAGQVKVNGYFERTDVGNSMEEVLTDIYTNTNYGGALDIADLDFPVTDATVDCAYESNQTIFDAMRKPALAQGYSVFLAGMDVIMKKDGVNNITSGMYNEMNILRDSLKVQYLFKEESPSYDGYEVSYIYGDGFVPKTYTYPANAIRPQKVDLFGVVDWGVSTSIPPPDIPVYDDTPLEISWTGQSAYTSVTITGAAMQYSNDGGASWETVGPGTVNTDGSPGPYILRELVFGSVTSCILGPRRFHTGDMVVKGGAVTNISGMFDGLTSLSTIDITLFDTRNAQDTDYLFYECSSLTEIKIGSLGTINNTNMDRMFYNCTNLASIDLRTIGMSNVVNTDSMFFNCLNLECITNIDTTASINKTNLFNNCDLMISPTTEEQVLISSAEGLDWVNTSPCPDNGPIIGDSEIPEKMAKYLFKQDDYRRKIVTFSTDIQGLVPQYLDKIMVSHSAVQWGEAGEVYGRTGDDLVLSDPLVDLSAGQTIVFRDIDGSVSTAYAIIIIDENNITVTGMPAWVMNNTFYTIQGMGTAKEFLVIAVKPAGEVVQIDCVNYSPEIYE